MKTLKLEKQGDVFIVTMDDGATANTFTEDVLREHMSVCEEIEKSAGSKAAVILTSSHPKFWTNGINLEWLMQQGSDYVPKFKDIIDEMLLCWTRLPLPTLACINGHAFGGGAILACGFDFRFMRQDKGFFCFPEIDVNIPFTDSMHDIIDCLPNKQALWELALTGKRVGGEEAKQKGIVTDCFSEQDLFPKVMELAQFLASKNRATYASIKKGLKKKLYL
ncbi:MAG: enoyl-CoA hydratase/isomerase family protein [Deltaproteobacteria bacterium]|nr:MAG: enoyl-CoA hydratase/isomerase family protein [Deltaproteobacteria bacterium]